MIIENLGSRIVNTYIIALSNGYMLIDTGYEHSFSRFKQKLKKAHIALHEISYIFLTHAHDDHAGFLNALLACTNAYVILHPKAVAGLRRGQNSFHGGCSGLSSYVFCKLMACMGKGRHMFPPLEQIYESRLLPIDSNAYQKLENQMPFSVIETPGHTECSISLLFDDGLCFCGDAVMNNFPSYKHVTIWIENLEDYTTSWRKLIQLHPKVLYPGHGKPFPVRDLEKNVISLAHIKLYPLK